METQDHITLAGLCWDKENLSVGEKTHFVWDAARKIAKSAGKRLPTKEEFEELRNLPHSWDKEKKGIWFAETVQNLGFPDKSLFFPAAGGYSQDSMMYLTGSYGLYWSDTLAGRYIYYMHFYDRSVQPGNFTSHYLELSVRCVIQ